MADPILLTVDEAAATLLCGRTKIYELLAQGVLVRGVTYGRKTAILAESVYAAAEKTYDPVPAPVRRRRVRGVEALKAELDEAWK